jgi:hypothetical protein
VTLGSPPESYSLQNMVDPVGRRIEVRVVERRLTAHEYELIALLATAPAASLPSYGNPA